MSNNSNDCFVKGEEEEQKDLNEVEIYYVITGPVNVSPTKVHLKIKSRDGRDIITITDTADLISTEIVEIVEGVQVAVKTYCITWDGKYQKEEGGEFIFVEDWLFTAQIEAYFADPLEPEPVKSNIHQITELSEKHKPKIFLHKNEFCGPIHFKLMGSDGMYEKDTYIYGYGIPILDLISNPSWNTVNHYLNFDDNDLKKSHLNTRKVFSRGKVENDLVFVQYWMFYPSSTEGTPDAQKEDVYHEGDWEMIQVVVEMDKEKKELKPIGATASQHYDGQTLTWTDVKVANKYNPVIYIAGGSHATYFTSSTFSVTWVDPFGLVWADYTDKPNKKAESYKLRPFAPIADYMWWAWGGHWGEFKESSWAERKAGYDGAASGPLSPMYRGTAPVPGSDDINIFENPKEFYKRYQ